MKQNDDKFYIKRKMRQNKKKQKKTFKIGDVYKSEEIIDINEYNALTNRDYEKAIKEKKQFDVERKKKLKDVEHWARAVREEEKLTIEKY